MQGIQGTIMTISRCIRDSESRKYELTRQLGLHFRSPNIGVAFCAIRQFDVYILRPYTIFVADQLVSVASAAEVPASPSPMSLRGIALKVLFDLDQNFRTWPQFSLHMKSVFPDATHGHWTGGTLIGVLCGVF